jgi:hypothetical protein
MRTAAGIGRSHRVERTLRVVAGVGGARQAHGPVRRHQAEAVPQTPPHLANPCPLQHHMLDPAGCQLVAHRQTGLARTDHDHREPTGCSDHHDVPPHQAVSEQDGLDGDGRRTAQEVQCLNPGPDGGAARGPVALRRKWPPASRQAGVGPDRRRASRWEAPAPGRVSPAPRSPRRARRRSTRALRDPSGRTPQDR